MNTASDPQPESPRYFSNPRPEVAAFLPGNSRRVLEVGCGEGLFRGYLPGDAEYWGVDPSASAAVAATAACSVFLHGTLEEVASRVPDGFFDLVIANDVIEHAVNHAEFLALVVRKLKPGGHLVGSIPNVRYFWNLVHLLVRKDWEYSKAGGILDETHLRFFTRTSFARTLRDSGLRVEKLEGINPVWASAFPVRRIVKRLLVGPWALVLGSDIAYMQFGFRARAPEAPSPLR